MWIKEIKKSNKGSDKIFIYHRLVNTYRTIKGPRHQTILNLGTLSIAKDKFKLLADRIEQISTGQKDIFPVDPEIEPLAEHYATQIISQKIKLFSIETPREENTKEYTEVDLSSLETSHVRSIGIENICLETIKELGLLEILDELGFSQDEKNYAVLTIISRLAGKGSELSILRWGESQSALDELLGCDFSHISRKKIYKIADKLFNNKEIIEERLRVNEKTLFSLQEKLILYDLTNTYFEGSASGNKKAKRGRSKEKRSDRPLLALGLVIDELGFIKRSKIMPGNVSEPSTLLTIINKLVKIEGTKDKPIVLIDAGISSEENLTMLRNLGYDYICVARNIPVTEEEKLKLPIPETVNVIKNNKKIVSLNMFRKLDENVLYCNSLQKQAKEQSMMRNYEKHFEEDFAYIASSLEKNRGIKKYEKVIERIGRLKERYSSIAQYYEITVEQNEKGLATKLTLEKKNQEKKEEHFNGSYYIRSSKQDINEQELWDLYITLRNIEGDFRILKSDLNLRPIFHQKEERSDAHIFVTLLAYRVLIAIQTKLKSKGIHKSWQIIRENLAMQMRVTTSVEAKDGGIIYIRNTTVDKRLYGEIYRALELKIKPLQSKKIKL